jgi:Protein of unknown function (DUF2939)
MTDVVKSSSRWSYVTIGLVIVALVFAGSFFLWRSSPGYSVYRIKQALETHDYELLSRYVDMDKVLDSTLDELGNSGADEEGDVSLGGVLGKLMRKGVFELLAGEAREVTKAGLSLFIEQAVKDRDRLPPHIPAVAPIAAWWLAQRDGDTARLTFRTKKDKSIDVTMQRTPEGIWRVVAVSNLRMFLPKLQKHLEGLSRKQQNSE